MSKPSVLVLRAAGVNCDVETAYAWQLAGARADCVHINRLREDPRQLQHYQVLTVPGGFSYGDDISAGKVFACQLQAFLKEALEKFISADRLVLGICNGFQVLCKAGLLPGRVAGADLPPATVTYNISGKYEDRWVKLRREAEHCVFLQAQEYYELPVAHGEGRVMARSEEDMNALERAGCVALRYCTKNADRFQDPCPYPDNPNGSMLDVAGLCDPSGKVFGFMPHPERFIESTQHPQWTSRPLSEPHGRAIFQSAVEYFR